MRKLLMLLPFLACTSLTGPDPRLDAEILGMQQMYCSETLPSHHLPHFCPVWQFSDTMVTELEWWPFTATVILPDGGFRQDTIWWTALRVAGRTDFADRRQWSLTKPDGRISVINAESLDPGEDQMMPPLSGWLFEHEVPLLVELEAHWDQGLVSDSLHVRLNR